MPNLEALARMNAKKAHLYEYRGWTLHNERKVSWRSGADLNGYSVGWKATKEVDGRIHSVPTVRTKKAVKAAIDNYERNYLNG